jgi:hypothetical protein
LWQCDPEEFAALMIKDVFNEVLTKGAVPTICYMQPGPPKPHESQEPGLQGIGIDQAFNSPSTLSSCTDFLRKHASDNACQSAMVVVRKGHVGYPCVWKGKESGKWEFGKSDGIFMQLEARGARAMYFTCIKNKGSKIEFGDTKMIDISEFGLLPPLF